MQDKKFIQLSYNQSLIKFSNIFNDPEYYIPSLINDGQKAIVYCMSRDSYTSSVFLDERTISTNTISYLVPLESIRHLFYLDETQVRPLNYIFHTAFCGSTLLCRALDKPGICLPYKEPYLLHQFSHAKRECFQFEKEMKNPGFLELSIKLLSRSFSLDEKPIIKPTDTCVNLSYELLQMIPGSKGIVLYEKLDEFILSGLKTQERREYIRYMVQRAQIDLASLGKLDDIDTQSLSDAKAAAYVWLGMMYMYEDVANKNKGFIKYLYSGDFFGDSLHSLTAVSGYFNLRFSELDLQEVCNSNLFNRNSKDQKQAFDLSGYQQEVKKASVLLAAEITEGVEWASNFQTGKLLTNIAPHSLLVSS